jgi:hypothetical protein
MPELQHKRSAECARMGLRITQRRRQHSCTDRLPSFGRDLEACDLNRLLTRAHRFDARRRKAGVDGLRFLTLAPRMMPDTDLGKQAVAGYARYLGVSEGDFIKSMAPPPTSSDVATGVMELLTSPNRRKETVFVVTGKGLEAAPL